VRTYENLIAYLCAKHPAIEAAVLDGLEGRNVVVAWRGRARRWTPPRSEREAVVPFDLTWPPAVPTPETRRRKENGMD
jgi:hypothetical protein